MTLNFTDMALFGKSYKRMTFYSGHVVTCKLIYLAIFSSCGLDLWQTSARMGQGEPSSRTSRSKLVSFESYHKNTLVRPQRTGTYPRGV